MTRLGVSVMLLALAATLAGCSAFNGPQGAATSPTGPDGSDDPRSSPDLVVGDPSTSGRDAWPRPFDARIKTFDLDGDGSDELIAQGQDRTVYVYRSTDGKAVATLPTRFPPAWYVERILNGVEAGVLEPGDAPSIVIGTHAAYVAAWRLVEKDAASGALRFDLAWETRLEECHKSPSMDAAPVIADVDGDGTLEMLLQTEEVGVYALNADGTTRWSHCWSGGNSAPMVDDLDGDGRLEAIFASDSGFISVFDADTGAPVWTFDARAPAVGISPASVPVTPTAVDLDGDGEKELVFTAREAPIDDVALFPTFHMAILAVHRDPATRLGALVWMRQPEWANPLSYTRILAFDVDHDGSVDLFGMDWNTIGHLPGDWEVFPTSHVFRLTGAGDEVWVRSLDAWWSNKDLALGDSNGDGRLDLLVNGPGDGGDGLWRISAADGRAEAFLSAGAWKLLRGPQLADLRHDGRMQLLYPVQPLDETLDRGAILVFDLGVPFVAPLAGTG